MVKNPSMKNLISNMSHVTGGGRASAKHPSFRTVKTALGNLKTSLSGTFHAFNLKKYAHR
jgi:hypothetical protein